MKQSPSWEANNDLASQETRTQGFFTVFTTTATGPYPEPDESVHASISYFFKIHFIISTFLIET
jgi:hypothetical protein